MTTPEDWTVGRSYGGTVNGDRVLESIGCTAQDWLGMDVRQRALMRGLAERCAEAKRALAIAQLDYDRLEHKFSKVEDAYSRLRYPDIQGTL